MIDTIAVKRRYLSAALFLSASLCAVGCSSSSSISGKVTYGDKTVPGGTVTFYGPDNWTGTASIAEDGSYSIPKAPLGAMKITVETKTAKPPTLPPNFMPKPPKDAPVTKGSMYDTEGQAKRYLEIPAKYADKEQSGLTCEVKSGKNTHPIQLK